MTLRSCRRWSGAFMTPVWTWRPYFAEALAAIGPRAGAAVPDLIRLPEDGIPDVRAGAAQLLGLIDPHAPGLVPALIRLLEDPALSVRLCPRYPGPRRAGAHRGRAGADPELA